MKRVGFQQCNTCKRVIVKKTENSTGYCDYCTKKREQVGHGNKKKDGIKVVDELIIHNRNINGVQEVMNSHNERIAQFVNDNKYKHRSIKMFCTISVKFTKERDGREISNTGHFICDPTIIMSNDQDDIDIFQMIQSSIEPKIEAFTKDGSDWLFNSIQLIKIGVGKYDPISGSGYFQLPKFIRDKKAVLNIQNDDEKCFLWAVLAGRYPTRDPKNANRVANYLPHENSVNTRGISFPVTKNDVKKFEENNDISLTIIANEGTNFFPFYISQNIRTHHINLLLVSNGEQSHYCLINNMSRLLRSSVSNHENQVFFCVRCLNHFGTQLLLDEHSDICKDFKIQKCVMPSMHPEYGVPKMLFKNVYKQLRLTFVIYADLESFLEKDSETGEINHRLASACYYTVSDHPLFENAPPKIFRGGNVAVNFLTSLWDLQDHFEELLSDENMVRDVNDMKNFDPLYHNNTEICSICSKKISANQIKVRDHCHLTGQYRGPAHQKCNLKMSIRQDKFKIGIVFHNGEKYDWHHLIRDMPIVGKIPKVIPHTDQNYIRITWGKHFVFLDSMHFLSDSLDNLVKSLKTGGESSFFHTNLYYGDKAKYVTKKGIFPYEFFDDEAKFDYPCLPDKEIFYDSLHDKAISDDEYSEAQKIWNIFQMRNFGDYHNLYLKCDVLLLADVCEAFRKQGMSNFGLDPFHYISLPSYCWDAMLKITRVKLELLTDINMYEFLESGIRGGISVISHRYSKANNKYLSDYDDTKESKYIIYLDKNSLYSEAMLNKLPISNFTWEDVNFTSEDILNIDENGDYAYIYQVDLDYPDHLHNTHNDYPLAPEHLEIDNDMLSPYNSKILGEKTCKVTKLCPNLLNKTNYIAHISNLKYYISKGLILKKVHKVLKFKQTNWITPYIDLCLENRKNAINDFDKNLHKKCMNAVFGKTMENIRNRLRVELVDCDERAVKYIAKPSFKTVSRFCDHLIGVTLSQIKITLNKPVYAGFAILELSKLSMAKFHYDHIKMLYGRKSKLLATDTDSYFYEIITDDLYKDMCENEYLYDFSNYPNDHPNFSNKNKKKVGCMKDETASKPITEFVGVRPKVYSITCEDGDRKFTNKGIANYVAKTITHNEYKECVLQSNAPDPKPINQIISKMHKIKTISQKKIVLHPYDNKRYLLDDGVTSRAYGHFANVEHILGNNFSHM